MELQKIAQDENMTYMEKVAAIVDEFAAGKIDGTTADAIAQEAGIAPKDLLAHYNNTSDLNKVASDEAANAETAELDKEAAEEAVSFMVKVAEDESATYLQKTAAIVDAFAAGAVTGEEADAIAQEVGVAPSDLASVFDAAYGDLGKEAGIAADLMAKGKGVLEAVKGRTGNIGEAAKGAKDVLSGKDLKSIEAAIATAKKAGASDANISRNYGKALAAAKSKTYGARAAAGGAGAAGAAGAYNLVGGKDGK